jgi:hypothetical protein
MSLLECPDCDRPSFVAEEDVFCGIAVSINPSTGKLRQRMPGPGPHYWQMVEDARAGDELERTGIGNYLRRKKDPNTDSRYAL